MGTVGALVPNSYSSFLRIHSPPSIPGDWWATYRDVCAVVAEIGARHTTTADRAWFAVWEGHGFDTAEVRLAWPDPAVDEAERQQRETARAQLRDDDRRRNAAISAGSSAIPRFDLPDRTYYLVVIAIAALPKPVDRPHIAARPRTRPGPRLSERRLEVRAIDLAPEVLEGTHIVGRHNSPKPSTNGTYALG